MADFKKMFGRYVWILAAVTLLGGGGLFAYLEIMGLKPTCEDKVCEVFEECKIDCEVYNPRYGRYGSIYVFNEGDFKLTFYPDIPNANLYVKYYGRWRYTNFTRETRFGNIPDDRKYVFVFPARTTKYFQVRVTLNSTQRIKWDFGPLDPVIIGWQVLYENLSRDVEVYNDVKIQVHSVYSSENDTWSKTYNYTTKEYSHTITEYYSGKRIGVKVGGEYYIGYYNVNDDNIVHWKYPIGNRNFKEYGDCREYELEKGVCTRTNLLGVSI